MLRPIALILALGLATTALAHSGVKNAAVKARMNGMERMAALSKVIGTGLKSGSEQDKIARTAQDLAAEADRMLKLFKHPANDPLSEASPNIWDAWPDFSAKVSATTKAAQNIQTATTREAQMTAFRDLGAACSACHKRYRE